MFQFRPLQTESSSGGDARLLFAASSGDLKLLKRLVNAVGKPVESIRDDKGRTALHYAAVGGMTHVCRYLVDEPPIDITDSFGETPLHHASAFDHSYSAASYLLDRNTNPNAPTNDYRRFTPLHFATGIGVKGLADLLLSRGAEVDAKTSSETALVFAAKDEAMVQLLLRHNANARSLNAIDETVLSNLSLCWARMKLGDEALLAAQACVMLRPDWPKAHYREGMAFNLLKVYREAARCFATGLKLDPRNEQLAHAFRQALGDLAVAAAQGKTV